MAIVACGIVASGCTFGNVLDAVSNAPLPGATLTFRHVDTSTTEAVSGSPVAFTSAIVSATSGPDTAGFNYWLDPYAPQNPGDITQTFVGIGWNRVDITAPGHASLLVYRNHQYSEGTVQTDVPYWAGPYPIPTTWDTATGSESMENFQLYPTSAHPLWPDLIVDVRSLAAWQVTAQFPAPLCPTNKCLSPGTITQVISQSAGQATSVAISGGMMVKPPDEGWHVADLVRITLRGPIVSGLCDTENTASVCAAVRSSFKEVCLEGTGGVFDAAYGGSFAQQAPLNCWPNGSAVTVSGPLRTGLAPGFSEFYSIANSENFLDVSTVASGTYWLEAEVNPNRIFQEGDTSNNIARVRVTL